MTRHIAASNAATRRAIVLEVNGERREVTADLFAPLSDTLREGLALTGTKVGCEAGDCGACTVLMDGRQVCACLVSTAQAEGVRIETIEGVGPGGVVDRLKATFLAHGAAQCGICTPGMIMAAAALLAEKPVPSDEDIAVAITNLCRCGTYPRVRRAIRAVADGHTNS